MAEDTDMIVVENFYADPYAVRSRALKNTFANIAATDYPGFASKTSISSAGLVASIEALVGARLNIDTSRFTWGGFRFITQESGQRTVVHADTAVEWAGMVYLTPEPCPDSGTGFYRHWETGLTGPPTDRWARGAGFADSSEFDDRVIRPVKANLAQWSLERSVDATFNRLILFRGEHLYHAPLGGFGDSEESARLTHIFFFNTYRKAAASTSYPFRSGGSCPVSRDESPEATR